MNRRSFIGSILALGVAPAIVRADSLMRIVPRETAVIIPDVDWFDGGLGPGRWEHDLIDVTEMGSNIRTYIRGLARFVPDPLPEAWQ